MKKILLSLFAISCFVSAIAQPILTAANYNFNVGEVFNSYTVQNTTLNPGTSGANQTWNFSSIFIPAVSNSNTVVSANTMPHFSQFPNSTVGFIDGQTVSGAGAFLYYKTTATSSELVGQHFNSNNSTSTFSNPLAVFSFPFTYNTVNIDPYKSATASSGLPTERTGKITSTADGYGTLVTPFGTYNNVLRTKTIDEYVDSAQGSPFFSGGSTTYNWSMPGIHSSLFSISDYSIKGPTGQVLLSGNYYSVLVANPVAINNHIKNSFQLNVYPTKTSTTVNVSLADNNRKIEHVDLYTIHGTKVFSNINYTNTTIAVVDLSVQPKGIYIVDVTVDGTHITEKIIKE